MAANKPVIDNWKLRKSYNTIYKGITRKSKIETRQWSICSLTRSHKFNHRVIFWSIFGKSIFCRFPMHSLYNFFSARNFFSPSSVVQIIFLYFLPFPPPSLHVFRWSIPSISQATTFSLLPPPPYPTVLSDTNIILCKLSHWQHMPHISQKRLYKALKSLDITFLLSNFAGVPARSRWSRIGYFAYPTKEK